MKKMKKIFAMLLAFTMVLGMTMTASAAITTPSKSDVAKVSVSGLEEGTTVTAYKIVDAKYYESGENGVGFKGYEVVQDVAALIANKFEGAEYNLEEPVSEHVTTIANEIAEGKLSLVSETLSAYDPATRTYSADLTAGAYVIIITNTDIAMYNPILAGVYYTNADGTENNITCGSVSANDSWTLEGTEAYVKSTIVPNFVKELVNSSSGNNVSDDVAIGDNVSFKITTTIPAYSKSYKELTFTITDTLDAGLTFNNDATVTIDGADDAEAYILKVEGQVMTITFNEAGIRAHGGEEVVVEYTANVNEDAELDYNQNTNIARLDYTNNPDGTTGYKVDETHHHTFDFQIKKTDEDNEVLGGATFTLYKESVSDENVVDTQVSDSTEGNTKGLVTFKGLDVGTYKLVETAAPAGYQIDNTVRTVVISAEYDETDKVIKSYTITIDDTTVESWVKPATGTVDATINMLTVMNTKLIALPSTGGIGTTIFTIAGCGIMIAAAFFFFAGRKKEN